GVSSPAPRQCGAACRDASRIRSHRLTGFLTMGLVLCAAGLISTWLATRRSLGHGLGLLLAIGSAYGIVRANVFDGFIHFLFDASVLGLYLGCGRRVLAEAGVRISRSGLWIGGLCA